MKNLILIVSMFAYCIDAYASGSTGYGNITHMYVNNNWTMVMAPDIANHPTINGNPGNCKHDDYYAIMPEDKNYNVLHSTLMAAQMAGKSVRFYVGGCSGQNGDYPHIVSVWIK